MPAPRPSSSAPAARLADPVERPETYVRFVDISDNLIDAALSFAESRGGGASEEWADRTARAIVDGVGAALLSGDTQSFVDHLASSVSGAGINGTPDIQLIGLLDAMADRLPEDLDLARDVFGAGRESLFLPERRPRPGLALAVAVEPHAPATAARVRPEPADVRSRWTSPSSPAPNPGQVFADLLMLGALACQSPVAVLSVPQAGGAWSTLSFGFERRDGLNDGQLYEAIATSPEPVELTDLVTRVPRSPLVLPPHSMRWAYGVALRNPSGTVIGVVAVLDRWLRQLSKREQRAMSSLARQLATHLSQFRRPAEPAPVVAHPSRPAEPAAAVEPTNGTGLAAVTHLGEAHQLLRSHEVAVIFDVTERTVINWAAGGKLPSLRTIGGHLRFRRDDVMRLLAGATEPELK
jgi:excisionase family DNA binding protein